MDPENSRVEEFEKARVMEVGFGLKIPSDGTTFLRENPLPLFSDSGKVIGAVNLSIGVGVDLLGEAFLDCATPERLDLELDPTLGTFRPIVTTIEETGDYLVTGVTLTTGRKP